jgi:hypothetical protein
MCRFCSDSTALMQSSAPREFGFDFKHVENRDPYLATAYDRLPLGFFLPISATDRPVPALATFSFRYCVDPRTRGQALLQLLCLVRILHNEGVEISLASNLELCLISSRALLDLGGCSNCQSAVFNARYLVLYIWHLSACRSR